MEGYITIGHHQCLEQALQKAFLTVLQDIRKYKALLDLHDEEADSIVDALHMTLNNRISYTERRPDLVKLLLRLSKRSSCYPRCLALHGIEVTGVTVAEGSFGEVRKGVFGGTYVCLKVVKIRRHNIETSQRAFAKEAILWSHLSHTNVLPFYGIYHLNDSYRRMCLVSPWMENGNVADYLRRHPGTNRLLLLQDIARGLQYLHQRKIVHGDLKGANILVASSGRACLGDFGLSSVSYNDVVRWPSLKSSTESGGTIRWQAPELVDPNLDEVHATRESDVYAFGGVCYEILTGNVPFYETHRLVSLVWKIHNGEKPSKPSLNPHDPNSAFHRGLTEEMWDLMQHCWERDPFRRPHMSAVLVQLIIPGGMDDRPLVDKRYGEIGEVVGGVVGYHFPFSRHRRSPPFLRQHHYR